MNPANVGSGVVTGGWDFVTASYAVCWILLLGYTVSLLVRARSSGGAR
jgi:hypothetical protein